MTGNETADFPEHYTLRGIPRSLEQDGWWLSCDQSADSPNLPPHAQTSWRDLTRWGGGVMLALALLVALADWLFWGYAPGLSVALFSWALFAAAVVVNGPDKIRHNKAKIKPALLFLLLSSLPVLEHLQALSLGFQLFGLSAALAWIHLPAKAPLARLPAAMIQLLRALPLTGLRQLLRRLAPKTTCPQSDAAQSKTAPSALSQHLRNWSFPLGGALVLITLLVQANPLLEHSLVGLFEFEFDVHALLQRALFWSGTALMIWPCLVPTPQPDMPKPQPDAVTRSRPLGLGLNAGSVLRALVTFNLILAVQTVMDFSILIGGAELPAGMTLATYAHRGAYPLLATAMLAGGFALAARRFLDSHASLKPLMMLWLGQNALLGLSSVLRLDLYVTSFGLTYMRIYAMIWIALVVAGLLLTGWQIHKRRSNRWLLLHCTGLGAATLYLCAFVNFASMIAAQNLSMRSTQQIDLYYICTLGPLASPGIHDARNANPGLMIPSGYHSCWHIPADPGNWREWGFRSWRVSSYAGLDFDGASAGKATGDEDPIGR